MELLAIKDRVYELLLSDAKYRNSDKKLVVAIWRQELSPELRGAFLTAYENGKLTPADTITRCRRKLQETIPALRGTMWNKRHEMEEEVKNQLRAF
jgi:hypothetical protein